MAIKKSLKSLKGIHVPHIKNTNEAASIPMTEVDEIIIPMQQHMGAPCNPVVSKGQFVRVGDKIGDTEEYFSAPIHASCSGIVLRVDDFSTVNGVKTKAVVIENDKKYMSSDDVRKPSVTDKQSFLCAIRESGLVGLGGAGFPVHVKLDYKDADRIDKLVINAAECEPYITADYRECLENTQNILDGIAAVQKYLDIKEVFIGIESNKPDAIRLMDEATVSMPNIQVVQLKQMYPQGAEKSILYATTGIKVKAGKLPADCGVLVMNVSSVGFIGKYLKDGMPLITKRITVDGDCVAEPKNLIVPIGTPIKDVLSCCATDMERCKKVLMGGPMMGTPVGSTTTPVIKNNNAILAFSTNFISERQTTNCIRCGKCIFVCPMKLMPTLLEKSYDAQNADELKRLDINLCINCGCCTYICPAKRQLAQKNQLAKSFIRKK